MTRDFLPDYGTISIGGRYRPVFKLFTNDNWRQVFKDRRPVLCDTASEAIGVAKERVRAILNSRIRVEHAPETEADVLGVEAWRQQREDGLIAERSRAFVASTVFVKGGKQVAVERKRKRA